jgi:hypothetical protein
VPRESDIQSSKNGRDVKAAPLIVPPVERVQPQAGQPQRIAPKVEIEPSADTARSQEKRQAAVPQTIIIQRAQPRVEQLQVKTPTAATMPKAGTTGRQERRKVIAPIARSADSAKTPAQTTTAAARTDRVARIDNVTTNTQKIDKAKPSDHSEIAKRIGENTKNDGKDTTSSVQQPTSNTIRLTSKNPQRLVPTKSTKLTGQPPAMKPDPKIATITMQPKIEKPSVKQAAPTVVQNSPQNRSQRRERIIRGTAGQEVSVPTTGKLMNVERAVHAVDADRTRNGGYGETTNINNKTTVVNNFGPRRDGYDGHWWNNRHDGHDGGSWNKGYHHDNDEHHSNIFLSLGFYSGYDYSPWPSIWDPAVAYEAPVCTTIAYSHGSGRPCRYRTVVYNHGPYYGFSYVYPAYHRQYMFVSIGGYWPYYPYARYYWYDYHPWYWYGAAPVAYPIGGADTYNYYTYNYYGNDAAGTRGALTPGSVVNGVEVPDYDALRAAAGRQVDVPAQVQLQTPAQMPLPAQPAAPTEADQLFDEAVRAFGDANYPAAIEKFRKAVRDEPNDVILPFAYAQALFANNDYEQAAAVLHTALAEMAPAKSEVFFPRGLYKDDDVLNAQIENLKRAVMMNPANAELQLLYGYQLLGIGKSDEAKVPLSVAKRDARTAGPAGSLLELIDRVKQESIKQ